MSFVSELKEDNMKPLVVLLSSFVIAIFVTKIINKDYSKFKILGSGEINFKLEVEVNFSSKTAKKKIEDAGGVIKIINSK